MPKTLTTLSAALILGLAAPLAAQDSTATQTETDTETQTEAQSGTEAPAAQGTADTGLSLGEEATDTEGPGSTYVAETIGDWEVQCIRAEEGEDPCQMYQLLTDEDGNAVAEVSLFRLPEGGQAVAGATIVAPLETLLTQQLTLAVDSGQGKRYPFSFCNPVGCYSRIGLTAGDVAAFKKGAVAKVTIVPFAAPDQKVTLDLSLNGFTASYDKVSVIEPAN